MATAQELVLKITADVAQAQLSVQQLSSQLSGLGKAATLKPSLSLDSVRASFTQAFGQLRNEFQRGFADVSTGVIGQLATNLGTLVNPAGAALAGITALGAGMKAAISAAIDYDAALTDVSVITGATGAQLDGLGSIAQDLALTFGGSVNSQLQLMSLTLSKLGPQLADNQEAFAAYLTNVETFAKAAGVDAATAGGALADVLLQLGVNTQDSTEVVAKSSEAINVMAVGAQLGAATVSQVAESLLQAGSTARTLGIGVVEVNAALQAMSLAGKTGSEAGVGLRNVLLRLSSSTQEAREALSSVGISFSDLQQTLSQRGLQAALTELQQGLSRISDPTQRAAVLTKLFGAENVAAAGGLLANVSAMDRFAAAMRQQQGLAQGTGAAFDQAATRMKSWSDVLDRLRSLIEVVAIRVGKVLLDALNELIALGQQIASAFAPVGDALMTVFGAVAGFVRDTIGGIVDAFGEIGSAGDRISTAFGVVRDAIAVVFSVVGSIASALGSVLSIVGRLVGLLVGGIVRAVVDTFSAIVRIASAVGTWLANLQPIQAAIEFIRARFAEVVGHVSAVVGWLKQLVGLNDDAKASAEARSKAEDAAAASAQSSATATADVAAKSQEAAKNWELMAERVQSAVQGVQRYRQLVERLLDVQAELRATELGLASPTTAQQIDVTRSKLDVVTSSLAKLARAANVDLTRLSGLDVTSTEAQQLADAIARAVPEVARLKAASDDSKDAQDKYAEALQRAREQVIATLLDQQKLRAELAKLNVTAATEQIKQLAEQLKAIDVKVTPEMVADPDAVERTRVQLQSLVEQVQAALVAETRPELRRQLDTVLADARKRLDDYTDAVATATREREQQLTELRIQAIADADERERVAAIARLERERDTALRRAELLRADAELRRQIEERYNEQINAIRGGQLEEEKRRIEQQRQLYTELFQLPAQAAEALAQGGEEGMKKFRQTVSAALLELAEAQLTYAIFGVTAAEVASKGVLGFGTAAVAIAIIRALFAALKAALQRGFKVGGYTGSGSVDQPAGIVHAREFVVRAPYADRYRPLLEAMNRGVLPQWGAPQSVRVHVDGGIRLQLRDGWIEAPRYVALRARHAV